MSTTPIVIGIVVAAVAFLASVPVMIRDSRRPLPPRVRKPVVVREGPPHRGAQRFEFLSATLERLRPSARVPGAGSGSAPPDPATVRAALPRHTGQPATAGAVAGARVQPPDEPLVHRRAVMLVAASVVILSLLAPRGGRSRRLARR